MSRTIPRNFTQSNVQAGLIFTLCQRLDNPSIPKNSEAYAVFDCFTIPSVATGLASHFKKMWVKDRHECRGFLRRFVEGFSHII